MKDEEEQPNPMSVDLLKQSLRKWAQKEVDKDRQAEIDALLSDAGVKPQPAQPDDHS